MTHPNKDLLYEVLDTVITVEPDGLWNQGAWIDYDENVCATTACFAGYTLIVQGGHVVTRKVNGTAYTEAYGVRMPDGRLVNPGDIAEEATDALGLTYEQADWLFNADNSLPRHQAHRRPDRYGGNTMNENTKLGAAVIGGYILGRTKKGGTALRFAMFLCGNPQAQQVVGKGRDAGQRCAGQRGGQADHRPGRGARCRRPSSGGDGRGAGPDGRHHQGPDRPDPEADRRRQRGGRVDRRDRERHRPTRSPTPVKKATVGSVGKVTATTKRKAAKAAEEKPDRARARVDR